MAKSQVSIVDDAIFLEKLQGSGGCVIVVILIDSDEVFGGYDLNLAFVAKNSMSAPLMMWTSQILLDTQMS